MARINEPHKPYGGEMNDQKNPQDQEMRNILLAQVLETSKKPSLLKSTKSFFKSLLNPAPPFDIEEWERLEKKPTRHKETPYRGHFNG